MVRTEQVSVVLPVHNERENLASLFQEIAGALESMPHEIVAVDDGSDDGSDGELRRLSAGKPHIRVVRLARRAGQSAALAAGFDAARGDIIATLDADGQNDPADLPALIQRVREGAAGAAVGYRVGRASGRWKALQSAIANRVRDRVTGDRIRDTGCSRRAGRADVLDRVPRFDGMHRFLPTLLRAAGATVLQAPVAERPRRHGASKYGMWNRVFVGLRDAVGVRWLRRRWLTYQLLEEETR